MKFQSQVKGVLYRFLPSIGKVNQKQHNTASPFNDIELLHKAPGEGHEILAGPEGSRDM